MERMRQTHSKEMESRDEEVEEARQSCQKKVRIPAPSRLVYRLFFLTALQRRAVSFYLSPLYRTAMLDQ